MIRHVLSVKLIFFDFPSDIGPTFCGMGERKKVLKLKLNSIWVKIHKILPSKVELKLSLSNPFSPGYQLPAKCVHLKNCEIVSKTAFKT